MRETLEAQLLKWKRARERKKRRNRKRERDTKRKLNRERTRYVRRGSQGMKPESETRQGDLTPVLVK